jgi:hypothetical protein
MAGFAVSPNGRFSDVHRGSIEKHVRQRQHETVRRTRAKTGSATMMEIRE